MKHQYLVKNIVARLIILSFFILVVCSVQAWAINPVSKLASPNKQIRIIAEIQNGTPVYSVWFNKNQIIRPSSLGLELASPFKGGFEMISKRKGKENSSWVPMYGENKVIPDQYNSLVIELKEKAAPHRLLNIEFRAYNEGFAFCYTIPEQPNANDWVIKKEHSEFRFTDQSEGYPIYRGEATFSKDAVSLKDIKAGACYPLTIDTKFGFASILEAFVVNYPRLRFGKTNTGDLVTAIMGDAKISAPFTTPWRAVILGKNEGKLIENEHFVLNLNPVCELKDVSWIKSGKTISNEGTFPLKTVDLKKMIDFAAENGFKYLQLDWGWYGTEVKWNAQQIDTFKTYMSSRLQNTNWEENAEANPFTVAKGWVPYGWQERWKNSQTFVDLDLQELIRYGKTKDIGICLYIEAGSTLRSVDMDLLFAEYHKWGVAGIKPGFVLYGSQENTDWIRNMVEIAAKHKLWVCIHDNHVPDGMERTYPNLFSSEGGGGSEGNHPVVQDVMLPFTRCLAGPFDYTPLLYKPTSTNAHMIAMLVVYYNPAHVVRGGYLAWNGTGNHGKGGEEIEFLKRLPSTWDETKVLDASIGNYLAVARRSGSSWFIGSITGDDAKTLDIDLNFLDSRKKYKATLFVDDTPNNTQKFFPAKKQEIDVTSTDKITLPMGKAGGCVVIIDETNMPRK